jgi:translocation and assembly module TamB
MTRIRRLTLALAVLLPLFLLLTALLYLLSDPGLNTTVRPRLERFLGERMEAEVRLERIALDLRRLEIFGILVEAPGRFRLVAKSMEVGFSLSELVARRLATLRVVEPELEVAESGEEGGGLPDRPPVSIGRIEVVQGRATLHAAGRTWLMEDILLEGMLDEVSPFLFATRVGEAPGLPLEMRGRLSWEDTPFLVLESGRLEGEELLTSPLTVAFPEGGAAAGGAIRVERFDHLQFNRIIAVLGIDSPLPPAGRFALEGVRLTFSWEDGRLKGAVTAQSAWGGFDEFEIDARNLRLRGEGAGEVWQSEGDLLLAGDIPLRFAGQTAQGETQGTFALRVADPAALLQHLSGGEWPRVSGGIEATGELSVSDGRLRLEATLAGTPGREAEKDLPDISGLSAQVSADRQGEKSFGTARLSLRGREIARAEGDMREVKVELHPIAARNLAALLPAHLRDRLPQDATGIAGRAVLRRDGGDWNGRIALLADRLPFAPALLEAVRLEGRFSRRGEKTTFRQGMFSARLSGDNIPAARLSAGASGEVGGESFRVALERFAAEDVEFIAADGMAGVSGAAAQGRGTIDGRLGGAVRLDLSVDLNAGEVLRGAFYADLSSLPVALRLQGNYDPGARRLTAERLTLTLPQIGEAHLQGSLAADLIDFDGTLELPDLKQSAARLHRVLGESFPVITEMSPAGALLVSAALHRNDAGWRLRGNVEPRRFDLHWEGARLRLTGLSGIIPFDLGSAPASGGERLGSLALQGLSYGAVELLDREIRLRSAPDRFALLDPLVFGMAGGELEMTESAANFAGDSPEFTAVLQVRGVDLRVLTRELDLIEMVGHLSADLGRIHYRGGTLTTDGEMKIEAFGGDLRVRKLRLDSLFTPYSTSSADIDFTGIDLRQVTATFAFGEINGTVDGYIRELRLFGAVPSHFEASFETRTKGRRNISVKALRNLTTISQGGLSAVLSRGIYRFIDFYRYRKIGLHCTLKNDVFVLRGTARDGTDRYLVDGGLLPPKINIIAPEHAISFKEMLNRLQRIDRTGGVGGN